MAVKTLKVLSAYDEQLIEELPLASPQDASRMLTAARKLADDPKKRLPIPERIEILERAQEILKDRYDEIVQAYIWRRRCFRSVDKASGTQGRQEASCIGHTTE